MWPLFGEGGWAVANARCLLPMQMPTQPKKEAPLPEEEEEQEEMSGGGVGVVVW